MSKPPSHWSDLVGQGSECSDSKTITGMAKTEGRGSQCCGVRRGLRKTLKMTIFELSIQG